METVYRKVVSEKGKVSYVPCGGEINFYREGVWIVTKNEYSRSITYASWCIPMRYDLDLQAYLTLKKKALQPIVDLLRELEDANSEAYKDLKSRKGGYVRQPLEVRGGLSRYDLAEEILAVVTKALETKEAH